MKFTYHYDHQTGQWHCFQVVDGRELYQVSKPLAEEARQWCEGQELVGLIPARCVELPIAMYGKFGESDAAEAK